jgi:hypothetical protein
MPNPIDRILASLPAYRDAAESMKETMLANLIVLGETPAPTFGEASRMHLLEQRFKDAKLQDIATDAIFNCSAALPGTDTTGSILVVAHSDTLFAEDVDHTISIESDSVTGPGVGDNSLGLAVLPCLPGLLEAAGIQLRSGLIMLGVTRSLGEANLEGIDFFLNHAAVPIRAAICLEGIQLGRLSIASIGMLRGEISCRVPEKYDWSRFGTGGAIFELNEVINRLVEIPLPARPRSSIVMGSIRGGTGFSRVATDAKLRFEIRSESAQMVEAITNQVEDIVAETHSASDAEVSLHILAKRTPGGLAAGHALPRTTRQIMDALELETRLAPSTSELSALINHGIPGVTLGLTRSGPTREQTESVQIDPTYTGLAQLLGILVAIDSGICDDE